MDAVAGTVHGNALRRGSGEAWGAFSPWYERRRRDLILAALPRERYRLGFEPGCSTGRTTRALASRCDSLVACDASTVAVDRARASLGSAPGLRVEHWAFPRRWPVLPCDLVVVAELGCYLEEADFQDFLTDVRAHMAVGGHLLLCHARAPLDEARLSGDEVHEQARRALALDHIGHWCDEHLRIDVWQRGGARDLAGGGSAHGPMAPAGNTPA